MTNYRRLRIPGATYFFTLCLQQKGSTALVDHIDLLRWAYARTVQELPVTCHAMVILPDHLHAVWSEPEGDVHYSERWRKIKARFSQGLPIATDRSASKVLKRDKGIWQRRFWEHAIRDEAEFRSCLTLCQNDPVRHGLVKDAADWPHSSFTRRRMSNDAHPAIPGQAARAAMVALPHHAISSSNPLAEGSRLASIFEMSPVPPPIGCTAYRSAPPM